MSSKKNTTDSGRDKNDKSKEKKKKGKSADEEGKEKAEQNEDVAKRQAWTKEMRCTEVMVSKEVINTSQSGSDKNSSLLGALIAETKLPSDDKTKSLTSFADLTWKPPAKQLDIIDFSKEKSLATKEKQVAPKDVQVGTANVSFDLPAKISMDVADAEMVSRFARRLPTEVKPMPQTRTCKSKEFISSNRAPQKLCILVSGAKENKVDTPLLPDQCITWEQAKESDAAKAYYLHNMPEYRRRRAYKTPIASSVAKNTNELQELHPRSMLIAKGRTRHAFMIASNDIVEINRSRVIRRTNDAAINFWLRRIILEAVFVDDPDLADEEAEEEPVVEAARPKCEKEEAIKDAIRAMLFSSDLTLNFMELLMFEHCCSNAEAYKPNLQQFMHAMIVNFLQEDDLDLLCEIVKVRGNNEQLIAFLLARLLEWVEVISDKTKMLPDKLPIPRNVHLKSLFDFQAQSENYSRHFLPRVVDANSFYIKALLNSSEVDRKKTIVPVTPFWIADEIRSVARAYQIPLNSQLLKNVPFLTRLHKEVQIRKTRLPQQAGWKDFMITPIDYEKKVQPKENEKKESNLLTTEKKDRSTASLSPAKTKPQCVIEKKKIKFVDSANEDADDDLSPAKIFERQMKAEAKIKTLTKKLAREMSKERKMSPKRNLKDAGRMAKFEPPPPLLPGFKSSGVAVGGDEEELFKWAVETTKRYEKLQQLPADDQLVERSKFLQEQGATLRRCREAWKNRLKQMKSAVQEDKEMDKFFQVKDGITENVIFKQFPPAFQAKEKKEEKVSSQDSSQSSSFMSSVWSMFSWKADSKVDPKAGGQDKVTTSQSPNPGSMVSVPKSTKPIPEEVNRFIDQLTVGVKHSQYIDLIEKRKTPKDPKGQSR